ncbi:BBP7 family outer membrane beta-barrel protein [Gemmata sp.]|uniref:BBP7 family outer membrane beta-barrel protein n=1 Tax=Gemmata sp. TaxID=1914242 RepID=UPI003F719E71
MRAVWVAVAFAFAGAADRAAAQELPPVAPGPGDGPSLPGGTEVSRPLTPVEIAPPIPAKPEPLPEGVERVEEVVKQKCRPRGPLGPNWDGMELLLWWPKAAPVPALVTATRAGGPPALSNSNTLVVVGGRSLSDQAIAGGRFTLGAALDDSQTVGAELVYFFLGSRTFKATVHGTGNNRIQSLGLPYTDATTGLEAAFASAAPNVATGSVHVTTSLRMQGAEANGVANLWDTNGFKLNGLAGYRFLQVNEGLTVEQRRFAPAGSGTIYDEFTGHNRFHGGQLGLNANVKHGAVFCEVTGKVALGQTFEVVRIDGATALGEVVPGGVYTSATNIGRYTRSAFAVAPEGTFKLGVCLSDSGRLFVGYNFLYLSEAVRPGDQIDRTLTPANVAALNPGGALVPGDRPRPLFNSSDFWAQGFTIGLETRY